MLTRLLATQHVHANKWHCPAGKFVAVLPWGSGYFRPTANLGLVGESFEANVLAFRPTIIRTVEPVSLKPAAEKYHDPRSSDYRRLRQMKRVKVDDYWMIYEGVELLLYLHGNYSGIATLLLTGRHAMRSFKAACGRGGMFEHDARKVFRFDIKTEQLRSWDWNTIDVQATDKTWDRLAMWHAQVDQFYGEAGKRKQVNFDAYHLIDETLHPRGFRDPSRGPGGVYLEGAEHLHGDDLLDLYESERHY